jgi:hypothetical protein
MISEHISQTFMYNIRDIKYDTIHDFKVSIPTSKNVLGRDLSKSLSAGSSA